MSSFRHSFSSYGSPSLKSGSVRQSAQRSLLSPVQRSGLGSPSYNASLSRAGNSIISNRSANSINEVTVVSGSRKSSHKGSQEFLQKDSYKGSYKGSVITSYKDSQAGSHKASYIGSLRSPNLQSQSAKSLHVPTPTYDQPSAIKSGKRPLRPTRPTPATMQAICAIYRLGQGYARSTQTYGQPDGMGFLLNEHLCMTAHTVLPTESAAIQSFAQFKSGPVFNFDPYRCFVTSEEHGFTVVAFQARSQEALRNIRPLSITLPFELQPEETVFYFPFDYFHLKQVMLINEVNFTFSSGLKEELLPGTPIFNVEWGLQGMYVASQEHVNQAIRLEHVLYYLDYTAATTKNPILENFLRLGEPDYSEDFFDRVFYYFTWYGRQIHRFDIDRGIWQTIEHRGLDDVVFCRNHRLVYLADSSVIIIGGISMETGKESSEVFLFSPQNYYTLSRLSPMLVPRNGPSCLHMRNYIYVFGGLPHAETCERYSVSRQKWQALAPMYYERTDSAACTALDSRYIFVFGGEPLERAGKTVERYSIEFNHWELLSLTLPTPLARLAVFPVTNKKLALMGGTDSHWVFVFRIEDMYEMGSVSLNMNSGSPTNYVVEDCGRPLDELTECVHPCAFVRSTNKLYLLNVKNLEYGQDLPGIVEYSVEYLDLASRVDYSNKPLELLAKMRTPYRTKRKQLHQSNS